MCYIVICSRIIMAQWIKTQEDLFRKICNFQFIVRVRKGYSRFCCERELETEQNCNILTPHSYGRQRCVFLVLQGCSTGGPGAHSAGWWLSLLHLISNFSGPRLIRAPRVPSAWPGFFYHILSATYLQTVPNSLTSVLTVLYNCSTSTQSPTRSLEWHVWSSSSGNNCHAVQWSLSSGVSFYECIMEFFTLSHFIS